jgi:CheY-like chemotaxis protein
MVFLFIDDDIDDIEFLSEAIREIDPAPVCHIAMNGQQGLQLLAHSLRLGFIFLDINMPLMDGKQTLQAIRKDHSLDQIPVCILSTSMASPEKETLTSIGANFCIRKAASIRELCNSLKSIFSFRQSIQ